MYSVEFDLLDSNAMRFIGKYQHFEDEGSVLPRKAGVSLLMHTALQSRRLTSTASLQRAPQISYIFYSMIEGNEIRVNFFKI